MKKYVLLYCIIFFFGCQNYGKLTLLSDLPKELEEVSGTETVSNSNLIWMLNDGGNKPKIYGVSENGKIVKEISIKAKNNDWEDLTSDEQGNLYIGDFGNNENKRKNLAILKVNNKDLSSSKKVEVEKIKFYYPNQTKFPPKKKQFFFDAESFFYYKNAFYIFTKSRVKNKFGKTSLYRVPAKKGNHEAEFISDLTTCNEMDCWITSADISKDGSKVVLLSPSSVYIFSAFKNDDFLSGKMETLLLNFNSQKEGISFKNDNTVFITDEKARGIGGNLYQFKLD